MLMQWRKSPWVSLHFILLLFFVIYRAIHVPLVSDEAFTFFLYVESETVFYPAAQVDANNHYLNSLLSIWSMKLFGINAFAFRFPNVLSFVLYYFGAFKIAQFSLEKWRFWIVLIGFTSIYPLLEFFSLSRGYGISFALLLYSIYQTTCYFEDDRKWRPWLILALLFLTILAQLSLLFACAALFFLTFLKLISNSWNTAKFKIIVFGLLACSMFLVFTIHIKGLQDGGFLYFGVTEHFPLDNIISLNELLFLSNSKWLYFTILALFGLTILGALVLFISKVKSNLFDKAFVFPFVLIASVGGILFAIFVLDGSGPLARTALYLYLLLIGSMLSLSTLTTRRNYSMPIVVLLASFFSMAQINLSQVNYWADQRVDNPVFEFLQSNYTEQKIVGSSIYIDRNIAMKLNHFLDFGKSVVIVESSIFHFDLVLLTPGDVNRFSEELKNFTCIYDGKDGVSLFQSIREKRDFEKISDLTLRVENSSHEFINLVSHELTDTLMNADIFVLSGTITCQKKKKSASINLVIQFFDNDGAYLHARYYPINRMSQSWNQNKPTQFHLPIAEIPRDTKEMRIFIYNPMLLEIDEMSIQATLYGSTLSR
jgi:hypothetical protein